MEKKLYDIDAAAAILGVNPERVKELVDQRLVDFEDQNGQPMLTKSAIMTLFDNVSPDPASTNVEIERHKALSEQKLQRLAKTKGGDSVIIVEAQEIKDLFDEIKKHADRVVSLIDKAKRIEERIKSHKKQAIGHEAEFDDLVLAHYPGLRGSYYEPEKLEDGTLIIKTDQRPVHNSKDYRRRLNNLLSEGVKSGEIPPGAIIGPIVGPHGPGGIMTDDDEEEEDDD